jgi:photosystem II stability/assembly factor-like uncharacterized protein
VTVTQLAFAASLGSMPMTLVGQTIVVCGLPDCDAARFASRKNHCAPQRFSRLVTQAAACAFLLALPLHAQYTFYACVTNTREYVVGSKLLPSGLFQKSPAGWEHEGYNHPFLTAIDYDSDPSILYISAGNALIRATDHGRTWKFLTGSDVTELRDVTVDRNAPGTIYFAYSHGIRVSRDRGATWQEIGTSLRRKYTEALRVDRHQAGVLLAGGEEGIFRSEDGGATWRIAGAAGFQVTRIEQSPHDSCDWLATTQKGGLFGSHDCGKTFENVGRAGVGRNLYDVAFDPTNPKRIAVAGWDPGLMISDDGGLTWQSRNTGLPSRAVVSVIFDPVKAGRIYASVSEQALYISDDGGRSWSMDGLEGTAVNRMKFIPDGLAR